MNKNIPIISRYILGLIFLVFGVAGLFNLIPPPPNMPEGLMTFMSGLMASKYFFPLLKLTESVCGLLLLINVAPALILVILAPITLNIVCVHLFLTPGIENLVMPVFILILHLLTAKKYWPVYRPLFDRN
ncbi:MAG: acyltransferase [Bdellovibrio sp. CG12_big_fil_rev_8_21_14_0_65_39_13]|nr:MAG: acyltransferase [Bdellovibrio sp. CG22_combo_CG10-13_8_21_14_all_39_27]PIQ57905.1 MAG: acyltransferase [Bdellovibrio sp. CG12_big_fil_rev_8_21_14_0_65_39_13]PIR35092.1 MAG: acyltransferase [Bdellovibrio sp. CG11_big_fil_rev_8_21_14_0_20_39_38]